MATQRILLAEDHELFRQGIRYLLSSVAEVEIVGETEDGAQAIAEARRLAPDILLLDLAMPRMNGTEAILQIKRRHPEIRIIAVTLHKSDQFVRAAFEAGVDGYVLKEDSQTELLAAIRSVVAGHTYLSPKICNQVVGGFLSNTSTASVTSGWDSLSEREREVLKLVAEGYKNREIADSLCVSIKTVEKHRMNLMKKLDLHNAAALTAYAIENGLASQRPVKPASSPRPASPGQEPSGPRIGPR